MMNLNAAKKTDLHVLWKIALGVYNFKTMWIYNRLYFDLSQISANS